MTVAGTAETTTVPTATDDATVVAPSREDPVATAFSPVVGGPAGDRIRAGRHNWWTAARVLVVLAMVVLSLGVVQKQHCRAQGWSTPDQFFHACYSDLPLMYESSGLAHGGLPYVHGLNGDYLAQPVLTGVAMWAVGVLTPSGSPFVRDHWYFDLSTVLIALLVMVLVALTVASAGPRRPWDAALVALSPLLALSALVSLDLLGVTLAAAGLLAWSRSRPALAGLLLGLAFTARTYPAVLVLVLALVALRSGRWREWAVTAGTALLTAVLVLLPWLAINPAGVRSVYSAWAHSTAGYGSLWVLPQVLPADPKPSWVSRLGWQSTTLSTGAVTTLAVLGLVLALAVGAVLVLGSDRRPRVAQVAFVVLAIVVITGKSWPVQASLWLLPLAALARPRWRDHLVWVTTEATYFVGVWLFIAGQSKADRGLPGAWYSLLLLVRVAGLLWLVWMVVRDVRRPAQDVVRVAGADDPLGGPFADAADALVLRFD